MRRSVRGPSETGRQRNQGPFALTQTSPSPSEGSLSVVPVRKTTKRHRYLLGTERVVWRTNEKGGPAPDTSSAPHTTGKGVRRERTELPTLPRVCGRALACEKPSSTYPDGKFSLREEQPGALGIRLLYQRGVQVQGQGRLGVFCCTLKQEAVTVTPLPPSFPRPLRLGQSLSRAPGPLGQSLGQTQRLAGSVIRKMTSFLTAELLG